MVIKQKQIEEMKRLRDENYSYKQIAKQLKLSHITVRKYLLKEAEGKKVDRNGDDEGKNEKKTYSKVFTAFDEGKNLIEVVKGGLCSPAEVEELWNKFNALKIKVLEEAELQKFQKQPITVKELIERLYKLEEAINRIEKGMDSMFEDIESINETIYGEIHKLILVPQPEWIKTNCKHYKKGFCKGFSWKSKPDMDEDGYFLKVIEVDGKWYVDPHPNHCALCPKNTLSRE